MGNFSREKTFNESKNYVGVRLQQGVPLVDADWNEMEDIRKHELRDFLKWYVGDGVPRGDDGFRIESDGTNNNNNNFNILAGRCIVKGWEIINWQSDPILTYQQQRLYNNGPLAVEWGVRPLPLWSAQVGRTDLIYLDVWEREVDSDEDTNLKLPGLQMETCIRTKREFVVRVEEGTADLPEIDPLDPLTKDHEYYPLATITLNPGAAAPEITDLRRRDVNLAAAVDELPNKLNGIFVRGMVTPKPDGTATTVTATTQDLTNRLVVVRGWASDMIDETPGWYTNPQENWPHGDVFEPLPDTSFQKFINDKNINNLDFKEVWAIVPPLGGSFGPFAYFKGVAIQFYLKIQPEGTFFSFEGAPQIGYAFMIMWQ